MIECVGMACLIVFMILSAWFTLDVRNWKDKD